MNTLQDFQCNEICIKTLQGVSHNVRSLPFVLIAALEGQKKKREYLVLFFFLTSEGMLTLRTYFALLTCK